MNDDFLSQVRRFGNYFHQWKSLLYRLTSDKKLLFMLTNISLISYMLFYVSNTQICYKLSSIAHFGIVAKDDLFWLSTVMSPQLICDITGIQDTGIVTSYWSIVIARANWWKGDLHYWITAVNLDIPPPSIHSLACMKLSLFIIWKQYWISTVSQNTKSSSCLSYMLRYLYWNPDICKYDV